MYSTIDNIEFSSSFFKNASISVTGVESSGCKERRAVIRSSFWDKWGKSIPLVDNNKFLYKRKMIKYNCSYI